MAVSELRLIKHCVEFVHKEYVKKVPRRTRGIYVLFKYRPRLKKYDVVYIGMAGGGKKLVLAAGSEHTGRTKAICGLTSQFLRFGTISEKMK